MRTTFSISTCLAAALLLGGCGGSPHSPDDPNYDSGKAKLALVTSLDAWKQGKAHTLAKQNPPIRFVDEDFLHGMRLTDYRLVKSDVPIRPFEGVEVELSLINRQGQSIKRPASYQVSLFPKAAVLRADP